MAAVAFTQTLIFRGTNNKRTIHVAQTVSDVAAAYAINPDGSDFLALPSDQNYELIDIIVVTGGTDTNFEQLFINGLDSGIKISNKSNLNTSNFRQFATAPITIKSGSVLKLKQSAS